MIRVDLAELGLADVVAVGAHQHRDGPEPVQGGDRGQRARPRLHEHADVLALAHADLEQPVDDVVDPLVDGRPRVAAVLEEQRDVVGRALRLLVDQQAEGDPRAGADPAEPVEPAELPGALAEQRARRAGRAEGRAGERLGGAEAGARGKLEPGAEPAADRAALVVVVLARPGRRPRAAGPSPARCRAQAATVGQVVSTEVEPTTRPKWPAGSEHS